MRNDLCAVAHVLTHARPRGVPLPHRGYTFDSAGLASATQPTLGNNASEEATPLGVVLFLIAHHYPPKRNRRGGACVPARTSAQRRFHTKNRFVHYTFCAGRLTMDAPLQGDTGGHTGPPLPNSIMPFCTIPLNGIIHPRAIRP